MKINNIKKTTLIILILSILLILTSCGGAREEAPPTTAIPTAKITFPEGYTVTQIAQRLEENGVCSATEFEELCKSVPNGYEALIDTNYKIEDVSPVFQLEGYIFPDTYEFYVGEGAKNALSRFLGVTRSRITDEYYDRAEELGLSINEVMTLASIIQSECGIASEMPIVSSVFHNRLSRQNNGFPYLGSDVTRHYIEKKLSGYIEENNLDYDSLFSAYCTNDGYDLKTQGLPLAPICNPGLAAIKAALWPDATEYLYFFTDSDGGFHYYTNYKDFTYEWNTKYKH